MNYSMSGFPVHLQTRSLPKLMSIEWVMPSSHLILCHPLLLLPQIPPSIRVLSNESTLHMRWPKYWSFSFSIRPSNEHPGLISFRMDWLDLLAVQGTLKSLLQHHSSKASILWCSAFLTVQLSHPYMTTGETIALTRWTFVGKVMSLLFKHIWSAAKPPTCPWGPRWCFCFAVPPCTADWSWLGRGLCGSFLVPSASRRLVWASLSPLSSPSTSRGLCALVLAPRACLLQHGACVHLSQFPRPALFVAGLLCTCFISLACPLCHRAKCSPFCSPGPPLCHVGCVHCPSLCASPPRAPGLPFGL